MHPDLADVIYRQRERELEQQREFRRVASERTTNGIRPVQPRAVWPALRSWWSTQTWAKAAAREPAACCASAAA